MTLPPHEFTQKRTNGIRGTVTQDAPLGAESWFGCGGTADLLFEPADETDLVQFLKNYKDEVLVIGGMANMIVRDGGIRGCVVRLGKPFSDITVDGTKITAGAGALNGSVAAAAVKAGIGGLEFLSGIPGTVGGALRMNAGAYGNEVKNILVYATAMNRQGAIQKFTATDMNMSYRHNAASEDTIFIGATFQGIQEDYDTVKARLTEIKKKRNETQPIKEKTGGSTFANPEGHKAWQLVEKVGGRDLRIGGASMSQLHLNFMLNDGTATAADLEALGDELIVRVKDQCGIDLHWEIKRVGVKS